MKYALRVIPTVVAALLVAMTSWATAASDGPCPGMIMMTVSGSGARIGGVAHAIGQVTGLRWYNNDDLVVFPSVEVYEAPDGESWGPGPLLASVSDVQGRCDDWSELALPSPVTSRTGLYYVVFALPLDSQYTGRGHGGGAAIGYASSGGDVRGFCSVDGDGWVGVRADMGVSVVSSEGGTAKSVAKPKGAVAPIVCAAQVRVLENPVKTGTAIAYRLTNSGPMALTLYDARGRVVRRLVSGAYGQGDFAVYWDGRDDTGRRAPSGTYIARLKSSLDVKSTRLVLVH